jgi:hypothetical protein
MVMHATLRRSGGIEALSRHVKVTPAQSGAMVAALVPAVLAGYHAHFDAAGRGEAGVDAVVALLAPFGGGRLAMAMIKPDPIDPALGESIVALIIADRELVLRQAAARSGLDEAELARFLPSLAVLIGGYLSARIEGVRGSGEDVVAEFEHLFERALPPADPPELSSRKAG